MTCNACGEKPKNTAKDFTKAVIEINNPDETLVLLRKVVVPASMGTEEQVPAAIGKYHNVILYYEANKHVYLYSSDGIPTLLEMDVPQEIIDRIDTLEDNVDDLNDAIDDVEQEIEDLKNSPDVVDIVATYAELQAYDTSSLGDKDVIRVLADETHDGESSYYRWSTSTQTWTFIGATGPYYTKDEVDAALANKANSNTTFWGQSINNGAVNGEIVFEGNLSTNGKGIKPVNNGIRLHGGQAAIYLHGTDATDGVADFNMATIKNIADGSADTDAVNVRQMNTAISGVTVPVVQTPGTSTTDAMSQNATTSMIFSDPTVRRHIIIGDGATNTGTGDGSVAIGYNSHAHGDTVSIGTDSGNNLALADHQINIGHGAGNNANHEYSISIGDYAEADYTGAIAIGSSSSTSGNAKATKLSAVAIGVGATANGERSVALGNGAFIDSAGTRSFSLGGQAYARGAVALGAGSAANTEGTVDVGAVWHISGETWGYLGSDYRRITGVYDGQALHDAATLAQANTLSDSAPTAATVGVLGQLYTDTTNMHTYQCTAIDTITDPDHPAYTWTQRW